MKRLPSLLLLATASCATALAASAPTMRKPLPYAQCVQTDKINEWHIVDARTALVRNGPHRYVVHLQSDCPRLGVGQLGFRLHANESNKAVGGGRICGEVGETVSARDQPPCAISSVDPVGRPGSSSCASMRCTTAAAPTCRLPGNRFANEKGPACRASFLYRAIAQSSSSSPM